MGGSESSLRVNIQC